VESVVNDSFGAVNSLAAKLAREHLFNRIADIRSNEFRHCPQDARRYEYEPNYARRVLCTVNIEFTET
jgi:hypothetical protein